jgi:hypothetical protein
MPVWLSIPPGSSVFPEWLDGIHADFYTWGTVVKALPIGVILSMVEAGGLGQSKLPSRTI